MLRTSKGWRFHRCALRLLPSYINLVEQAFLIDNGPELSWVIISSTANITNLPWVTFLAFTHLFIASLYHWLSIMQIFAEELRWRHKLYIYLFGCYLSHCKLGKPLLWIYWIICTINLGLWPSGTAAVNHPFETSLNIYKITP
jgi:hypothetical protein